MSIYTGLSKVFNIDTDTFDKVIRDAKVYASEESLNTSLRNVTDLFIRSFNVLKITTTRFLRTVKRGELEKYVNDHTTLVSGLQKVSYLDISSEKIDVPYGMNTSYAQAVDVITNIFNSLDLDIQLTNVIASLKQIRTVALNEGDISPLVAELAANTAPKIAQLEELGKSRNVTFGTSSKDTTFGAAFKSMSELADVTSNTIAAEKHLADAERMSALGKEVMGIIDDITVKPNTVISNTTSQQLASVALVLAKSMELYGLACLDLMSVSHNLVLVYNTIYRKVR